MRNIISHKNEPVLKVLSYKVLYQGLELSDQNVIQAWEDMITLAPWVPTRNIFPWEIWNLVETLAREIEKLFDISQPLGFYPTIMPLKACFHPDNLPPPRKR